DRAYGSRGRAGLAGRPRGGDHMNGGAEPAHGLAKGRCLDGTHGRGPHHREGTIHSVVGALVEPAHVVILSVWIPASAHHSSMHSSMRVITLACSAIEMRGSRERCPVAVDLP